MSKQRYLLIALVLGISLLCGQISLQNQSELLYSGDVKTQDFIVRDQLFVSYLAASGLRWDFSNDFMRRDYKAEDQQQRVYNSLASSVSYKKKSSYARLGLRNTLYGDAEEMALFPQLQPLMVYDKKMQNTAYLSLEKGFAPVLIELNAMYKALDVSPWEYVFDLETFELLKQEKPDDRIVDWWAELKSTIQILEDTQLFAGFTHYESDVDAAKRNTLGQSELGLSYQNKLSYNLDLEASWDWQNRQSDVISTERRNLYNSSFRIRYGLTPQLTMGLGYANHLCSDDKISEVLLISNYVRGYLKYSYSYDESGSSFSALALKYSPENEASALLFNSDMKVMRPLWLGAELLYSPDSYVSYGARATLRIGAYDALVGSFEYRENLADSSLWRQIGIGYNYYY
jgi:hypothetical protein